MLVLWQVVTGLNQLSEKEQLAEAEVCKDLQTIVLARAAVLAQRAMNMRGKDEKILEWSEFAGAATKGRRDCCP